MTLKVFDIYMETNYNNDAFVYGGYSVNVDPPGSWDTITFTPIKTKLNRTIRPPLMEPGNDNGYEIYWKISMPVRIHLNDLDMKLNSYHKTSQWKRSSHRAILFFAI